MLRETFKQEINPYFLYLERLFLLKVFFFKAGSHLPHYFQPESYIVLVLQQTNELF